MTRGKCDSAREIANGKSITLLPHLIATLPTAALTVLRLVVRLLDHTFFIKRIPHP